MAASGEREVERAAIRRPLFSFRSAYSRFSLLLLAVTIVSLVPQYFSTLLNAPGEMSAELALHGAAFLAWYILFTLQSGLVSAGRVATHRKLGYLSIPFAAFLIVSGAAMLIGTMQSYQPDWTDQHLFSRTSFVWAIFHTLVSFGTFYIFAIVLRRRSAHHKRFILLASLSMMAASITRFAYLPIIPIDGTAFTLLSTYLLLAVPLVIDLRRHGRIHPVLKYGTGIYVVTQLLAMGVLPGTDFGRGLAFPF